MAQKVTPERQRLYSLIDDLPEQELTAATRYLEFLAAQSDEQQSEAEYHEFLRRRVKECDEARARGEVRADVDAALILELAVAPHYLRVLLGGGAPDDEFVTDVVGIVLRGVSA